MPSTASALVAHLPAVAVRAVQHVVAPELAHAGQVGQLVDQAGGDEQAARVQRLAVGGVDGEQVAVAPGGDGGARAHAATVGLHLRAAETHELGGRQAVAA